MRPFAVAMAALWLGLGAWVLTAATGPGIGFLVVGALWLAAGLSARVRAVALASLDPRRRADR